MVARDADVGPRVVLGLCLASGGIGAILTALGVIPLERAAGGLGLLAFIGLGCQHQIVKRLEGEVAALRQQAVGGHGTATARPLDSADPGYRGSATPEL